MGIIERLSCNGPLNFAHRGFVSPAGPENTLAAFEAALELGVDGIEFDVRMCKSGEIIVFHDATLQRLTGARGFVSKSNLAELRKLRILSTEERIPLLSEVLELTKEKAMLNVEIKANGINQRGLERNVVNLLKKHDLINDTIISSFNPLVLAKINKQKTGDLNTGYLVDRNFRLWNSAILVGKALSARALHIDHRLAKPRFLKRIRKSGLFCLAWTVNKKEDMQALIEMGVHGIITDKPEQLKALL
jgi:glycerophosphoryl diester phosphodiesterase